MCAGTWVGELRPSPELTAVADERYPVALVLVESEGVVSGTVGPGLADVRHGRVESGSFDSTTGRLLLRFASINEPEESLALDGILTADAMTGHFVYGEAGRGSFELRRISS